MYSIKNKADTKFAGFQPITPQGDSDELADKGERLLIYFPKRWNIGEPVQTKFAEKGMLTSGWVIGIKEC